MVAKKTQQRMMTPPATAHASIPAGSMIDIGPEALALVRCQAEDPFTRMGVEALLGLEQAALAQKGARCAGMPG